MSRSTVAIIGSGIVGTAIAHALTKRGHQVDVFEKGPNYPYPHTKQYSEKIRFLYNNPVYRLPKDLKNLTLSGDYKGSPDAERYMLVGGSATQWEAMTIRMGPNDFKTKTLYGYGEDWPLTYADLEPYYCKAEALLAVSGTDADNPFAPWRSSDYPLPPFELAHDDKIMAERLRAKGIALHTTPQARTRKPHDGRPGCQNFGVCQVCPIGARYSPNHHLSQAVATGFCKVHDNVSVRRVILDQLGKAKALVYRPNNAATDNEHGADVIVLAAGAFESARLLLLSADSRRPGGLGNDGGHVGKHFTFHHKWDGSLHYRSPLYPGRFGGDTGQSHQFLNPPSRGRHGGVKVEFSSKAMVTKITKWGTQSDIITQLRPKLHWRPIGLHAESAPSSEKYIALSEERDRFGDRFAHVHYRSSEFDAETHRFALDLLDRFALATGADDRILPDGFSSGAHHMGGCRIGQTGADSVVDQFSRVHGTSNMFVVGGANFSGGTSGAVNPTLTMVALALRTADFIVDQNL